MKKTHLFILITIFMFSCKKETFNNENIGKQNALVIYFGGTWCSPCGQYGKPTKEEYIEIPNIIFGVLALFLLKIAPK